MSLIISAAIYETATHYNRVIKATVFGCWTIRFDQLLEGQSEISPNLEFYGATRKEAIANAVAFLKSKGLSGSLKLHN